MTVPSNMAKLLVKNTFLLDLSSAHLASLYFPGSLEGHRISSLVKNVSRNDGGHFQTKVFKKWVHPAESRLQWSTTRQMIEHGAQHHRTEESHLTH